MFWGIYVTDEKINGVTILFSVKRQKKIDFSYAKIKRLSQYFLTTPSTRREVLYILLHVPLGRKLDTFIT